jgi:prepilin-type N-terminal cleavage/methylation domain-containing protein/prepilin-type processing-associated H-X9-DG protein
MREPDFRQNGFKAFTLIELLVVIAIIVILAAMVLPAVVRAKAASLSSSCVGRLGQLQTCFREYTDDNGQFPSNNLVAVLGYGTILGTSWAIDDAMDQGALFEYNKSRDLYRCPSDRSTVPSPDGTGTVPRPRTFNMSVWFNCIAEPNGYQREAEMDSCGKPVSEIFVFIDTHPNSIVDPVFGIYPANDAWRRNLWIDLPSDRHLQGANLGFLDGHIEHHRWKSPKILQSQPQSSSQGPDRDDLRWLQDRIPPPANRGL